MGGRTCLGHHSCHVSHPNLTLRGLFTYLWVSTRHVSELSLTNLCVREKSNCEQKTRKVISVNTAMIKHVGMHLEVPSTLLLLVEKYLTRFGRHFLHQAEVAKIDLFGARLCIKKVPNGKFWLERSSYLIKFRGGVPLYSVRKVSFCKKSPVTEFENYGVELVFLMVIFRGQLFEYSDLLYFRCPPKTA